jgi:hypothetical protein
MKWARHYRNEVWKHARGHSPELAVIVHGRGATFKVVQQKVIKHCEGEHGLGPVERCREKSMSKHLNVRTHGIRTITASNLQAMNSGLVDDDHGVFLRLELWSGHKWQIFRLELVFRFVFFEQIPPIRDRRTLFSIMAKVYDESHMSETTPLEESSIPLTDPVERIAAMLTPATASAIERLAKTILTFVHPILLADDASPVFWWSFSIQEVMQIRFLPWQPLPEVVILTLEFFILSHHLNES